MSLATVAGFHTVKAIHLWEFRDLTLHIILPPGRAHIQYAPLSLSLSLCLQLDPFCCSCDYIEFHDGPTLDDPLITVYDGCDSSPSGFIAPGQYVTARFVTDSSSNGRGFYLEFGRY